MPDRADGHDACLGEIPGAVNACCGHGYIDVAYIQYRAVDAPDVPGEWMCGCVDIEHPHTEGGECPGCHWQITFRIAGAAVFEFLGRGEP